MHLLERKGLWFHHRFKTKVLGLSVINAQCCFHSECGFPSKIRWNRWNYDAAMEEHVTSCNHSHDFKRSVCTKENRCEIPLLVRTWKARTVSVLTWNRSDYDSFIEEHIMSYDSFIEEHIMSCNSPNFKTMISVHNHHIAEIWVSNAVQFNC